MTRSNLTSFVTLAALLVAVLTCGCGAMLSPGVAAPSATRESSTQVILNGEELTLHLASPMTPRSASTPLVLYASGDGGWFGAAVGMFRTLASSGLPTVGFSTKSLMTIEHRRPKPLTVAHIASDYERIIEAARTELQLPPETPVILTGWSRGASLGVLVASSRASDSRVLGLVAIGLAANEQLDIEGDSDEDDGVTAAPAIGADPPHGRSFALYPLLARILPRRVVVIQASGDGYLPAARARELFGADSTDSQLVTIDARNHRFNGGEERFAAALLESVSWVSCGAARAMQPGC